MHIGKAVFLAAAVAGGALGALSISAAVAQTANAPVVVINLPKVLVDSTAGQDMRVKLKALVDGKQSEFRSQNQSVVQAMETEGRALQPLVQGKTEAQIVADPGLKTRFEAHMRRQQELVQKRQVLDASIQLTAEKAEADILRLLDPVVAQSMAARGATVVLNAQTVAKASPSVDITADVTSRFNTSNPRAPQPTWAPYTPPAQQQPAPATVAPGAPKKK